MRIKADRSSRAMNGDGADSAGHTSGRHSSPFPATSLLWCCAWFFELVKGARLADTFLGPSGPTLTHLLHLPGTNPMKVRGSSAPMRDRQMKVRVQPCSKGTGGFVPASMMPPATASSPGKFGVPRIVTCQLPRSPLTGQIQSPLSTSCKCH